MTYLIIAFLGGLFSAFLLREFIEYKKGRKFYIVRGFKPNDQYFFSPHTVASVLGMTELEATKFLFHFDDETQPFKMGRIQVYQQKVSR